MRLMALTCDRCLGGRHSILCETGDCACSICARPSFKRIQPKPKRPRSSRPRGPEKPRPPRVLSPEQRQRYSEAQKIRYREARNDPRWVWNADDFSGRLIVLFDELSKESVE